MARSKFVHFALRFNAMSFNAINSIIKYAKSKYTEIKFTNNILKYTKIKYTKNILNIQQIFNKYQTNNLLGPPGPSAPPALYHKHANIFEMLWGASGAFGPSGLVPQTRYQDKSVLGLRGLRPLRPYTTNTLAY